MLARGGEAFWFRTGKPAPAPVAASVVAVGRQAAAVLAVHGRLPAPVTIAEPGPRYAWPYDQVDDPALRWRYVARTAPRSFPRRADDHAARVAAGGLVLLHAQVRTEARELVEDGITRSADEVKALGLVDIKVCAVDVTWSGLKLVIPLAARPADAHGSSRR